MGSRPPVGASGKGASRSTDDRLCPLPGPGDVPPPAAALTQSEELIRVRISEAAGLARRLTLGGGFSPDGRRVHPQLAKVIIASVTRSLLNPSLPLTLVGPPLSPRPGSFATWTLHELSLMERLRSTASGQVREAGSPHHLDGDPEV
jgi:hypothetical protein